MKAVRLIAAAPVIAYFAKAGRRGNARAIVDRWMTAAAPRKCRCYYPVTTEMPFDDPVYNRQLAAFYEERGGRHRAHLAAGRDVALLSEGDPLFYGSFMHLYIRLRERFAVTIVPGVSGMAGCWSAAGEPMTWGDDVLTVLPGTLPPKVLIEKLAATDAAVIMKIGKQFRRKSAKPCASAACTSGRSMSSAARWKARKSWRSTNKTDDAAPYFAIILVSGQGRRP